MQGTIGEIRLFAGNYAPRGWALCNGQILSPAANQALFSVIGTIYGGDGRNTFALPDLRGRTAIGSGNGPGLTSRREGDRPGTEYNTLTIKNLPTHNHAASAKVVVQAAIDKNTFNAAIDLYGTVDNGTSQSPAGNMLAKTGLTDKEYTSPGSGNESPMAEGSVALSSNVPITTTADAVVTVGHTGGSQAVNNMQPSLAIYYIICMDGTYPTRD